MHPIVDGIEIEYGNKLLVYRLNYRNLENETILHFYAIRTHPVLLFINSTGAVLKRWNGLVSPTEIREFLKYSFDD